MKNTHTHTHRVGYMEKVRCFVSSLTWKKYKTKHDRIEKVINWEVCKRLNFEHTNKWYMHKAESALKNETHQILWDFEMQTDHLILARRSDQTWLDLTLIKKKKEIRTCHLVDLGIPADQSKKKKSEEREILGPYQKTKIRMKRRWWWY